VISNPTVWKVQICKTSGALAGGIQPLRAMCAMIRFRKSNMRFMFSRRRWGRFHVR
jgi:hypothetical protein